MGVHGVTVHPVPLVVAQRLRIHLAGSDHIVTEFAIHVVAVHSEALGEAVEVLQLLLLRERGAQNFWVEEANIGQRVGIACYFLVGGPLSTPVVHVGDFVVSKAIGVARRLDIAADVGGFFFRAVRLNRELLHHIRPGHTDNQGTKQHQHCGKSWNAHITQHDRREERGCHHHGNDHEEDFRRQNRVNRGISGTGEHSLLGA